MIRPASNSQTRPITDERNPRHDCARARGSDAAILRIVRQFAKASPRPSPSIAEWF